MTAGLLILVAGLSCAACGAFPWAQHHRYRESLLTASAVGNFLIVTGAGVTVIGVALEIVKRSFYV